MVVEVGRDRLGRRRSIRYSRWRVFPDRFVDRPSLALSPLLYALRVLPKSFCAGKAVRSRTARARFARTLGARSFGCIERFRPRSESDVERQYVGRNARRRVDEDRARSSNAGFRYSASDGSSPIRDYTLNFGGGRATMTPSFNGWEPPGTIFGFGRAPPTRWPSFRITTRSHVGLHPFRLVASSGRLFR